ncbi:MAG TPA: hypothetical protein VH326_05985, partial [Sphingomonas sp.]|nr:hypothetical protein [Sphingomonas sp.]
SGGFTHSAGEVIATYTGSTWLIQGDSDGDGVADLSIQVDQASSYAWSAADFHLAPAPNALVLPIDSVTSNDMLVVSMDVLSSGQPAPASNDTDTFGLHHLMLDHVSQPGYDHIV